MWCNSTGYYDSSVADGEAARAFVTDPLPHHLGWIIDRFLF
jgi:hypothetical protein